MKKKIAHICPIMCAELLSGEFNCLDKGKIGTLWTPGYVDKFEAESGN